MVSAFPPDDMPNNPPDPSDEAFSAPAPSEHESPHTRQPLLGMVGTSGGMPVTTASWWETPFARERLPLMLSGVACVMASLSLVMNLQAAQWQGELASKTVQAQVNPPAKPMLRKPASLKVVDPENQVIADIAEQIAPSVVNIDVLRKQPAQNVPTELPFDDPVLRKFFGITPDSPHGPSLAQPEEAPSRQGNGSGVILDTEGHVITNLHVVNMADVITVTTSDHTQYNAHVVGSDPFSDLAVLKLDAPLEGEATQGKESTQLTALKPAALGDSGSLRPGEWVMAVGSPLGFDHTVTMGIVSALSRKIPDLSHEVDYIQTDAAINPGNSGGPLINLHGEVVGITTAISGRAQNIGFAIPANTVKTIAQQLIANGQVTRPFVGIAMTALTPDIAKSLGLLENTPGVLVSQIIADSPAEQAGIQQGDIIYEINQKAVATPEEIQKVIKAQPVGTSFTLSLLRDKQHIEKSVQSRQWTVSRQVDTN